jgi:hypothetical protein
VTASAFPYALSFALAAITLAAAPEAELRYFTTERHVHIHDASRQNYLILDPEVWEQARPDLADLRLYDGEKQVAYELTQARGESTSEEHEVKLLNLARVGDHTEFDLDMQSVPEYDHIRLKLDAKNFVISASAAGGNSLADKAAAPWPTPSTLYDFTAEKLGANLAIALPAWSFHYVHVKLTRGIKPEQVRGAVVSNLQERKAAYIPAGTCKKIDPKPHRTTLSCDLFGKIPIDRVAFTIGPGDVNFLRPVMIQDEKGNRFASGEISRIHARRGGQTVMTEAVVVQANSVCCSRLNIEIENGDDPSLDITSAQPQSIQRRIYFDPAGRSALKLYYGDSKLSHPSYDYAKFFKEETDAMQAELSSVTQNANYSPRRDDRPWSEQHKSLLWIVMLVAVAVMAWLAIRGLREKPTP